VRNNDPDLIDSHIANIMSLNSLFSHYKEGVFQILINRDLIHELAQKY